MKHRLKKIEATDQVADLLENAQIEKLARSVVARMDKVPLHRYQAEIKKLSDNELVALCWWNENRSAHAVAWHKVSTSDLEQLVNGEDVHVPVAGKTTPVEYKRLRAFLTHP